MYELTVVCMYCGKEYARKPTDRPPSGPSHGICSVCEPYAIMEAKACADGDKVMQAQMKRILSWLGFMADSRRRGQRIRYTEGA